MTCTFPLRLIKNAKRCERGATAVEFALVAPVFLLFMLGIADLGRLFWVKNLMQFGVEQTARYAMVTPTASASDLETYATAEVNGMFGGISFLASTETVSGVDYRTITASYTFQFLMPLVQADMALSAKSRTPVNTI